MRLSVLAALRGLLKKPFPLRPTHSDEARQELIFSALEAELLAQIEAQEAQLLMTARAAVRSREQGHQVNAQMRTSNQRIRDLIFLRLDKLRAQVAAGTVDDFKTLYRLIEDQLDKVFS